MKHTQHPWSKKVAVELDIHLALLARISIVVRLLSDYCE